MIDNEFATLVTKTATAVLGLGETTTYGDANDALVELLTYAQENRTKRDLAAITGLVAMCEIGLEDAEAADANGYETTAKTKISQVVALLGTGWGLIEI